MVNIKNSIGIFLILFSIVTFLFGFFSIQGKDKNKLLVEQSVITAEHVGLGADFQNNLKLKLQYPGKIGEKQSFNILLKLERERYPATWSEKIELSMFATNFNHVPNDPLIISLPSKKSDSEGDDYRDSFTWNVVPRPGAIGKQELFIKLSGINLKKYLKPQKGLPSRSSLSYIRNSTEVPFTEILDGIIPISIYVNSVYGVPFYWVTIAQIISGISGFILTYPLVIDFIKKK